MSFDRLLVHYLSLSKESLSIDCYVSIPRTHRSLFQSIVTSVSVSHSKEFLSIAGYQMVTSVSLRLSGFSLILLLRLYFAHHRTGHFYSYESVPWTLKYMVRRRTISHFIKMFFAIKKYRLPEDHFPIHFSVSWCFVCLFAKSQCVLKSLHEKPWVVRKKNCVQYCNL